MKNLIWLASYPKSGNTWLRVFLTNLLSKSDKPSSINQLYPLYWANDNSLIEKYSLFEASELNAIELDEIRQEVYLKYAKSLKEEAFLKTHHASFILNQENSFINSAITKGVVYLVRNPFDVAISLAHHQEITVDKAIRFMNNDQAYLGTPNNNQNTGAEFVSSWSKNYLSYKQNHVPTLIVKYEDLVLQPELYFGKIVEFLKIKASESEIKKAVEYSHFEVLKKQEEKDGFNQGSGSKSGFFRVGNVGQGKASLSTQQKKMIVKNHQEVIQELGYF
tara:strand:+ start:9128 stop:9958 length:831 start_codon:yes stop_codon:yes gene_type:complete